MDINFKSGSSESKQYKKTAIIVVTYKAIDYVKKCIGSIQKHTHIPYELIVIDNNSNDQVPHYLKSIKDITLILNHENRLLTPAQNQGLKAIADDAAYVLFLNPDMEIFREDWLIRMINLLESDEHIGIVGPICNYHPLGPLKGNIDMCCLLVRRQVIDVCGLDENYPWNGAGLVLTASAWSRGWRYKHLRYPKIVTHHGAKSRAYHHIVNDSINQRDIFRHFGLTPRWSLWGLFRQIFIRPGTLWKMMIKKS